MEIIEAALVFFYCYRFSLMFSDSLAIFYSTYIWLKLYYYENKIKLHLYVAIPQKCTTSRS